MNYKVWRKQSDNSIVGFCEETYVGFEPGGDLKTYTVSIEASAPVMPPPPINAKLTALLADPTVPSSVKTFLS